MASFFSIRSITSSAARFCSARLGRVSRKLLRNSRKSNGFLSGMPFHARMARSISRADTVVNASVTSSHSNRSPIDGIISSR
ncbi:MAG: hypothetical protein OXH68_20660 [Gammaproteobacteria bacterium]|nr:hypothetical protein [Gammaproteobacteria bacterium]